MTRPRLAAGGVSGRADPARWADLHIARGTAAMSVQSVLYEPVRAGRAHNTELELTQVSTDLVNFFLPKVAQGLPHKVPQNPAALAPPFFSLSAKNLRGVHYPPCPGEG